MSINTLLQSFKDKVRIVINDRFIGDNGAKQLAVFLQNHGRVQSLQIKSNDISSEGFIHIFESLRKNKKIRHLNIEYNNLGQQANDDWQSCLNHLIADSAYLERLNISNNKITSDSLLKIIPIIAQSKSLKLFEIRYNSITSKDIETLAQELKSSRNQSLLYVELSGNKIKKETIEVLEGALKQNRQKNPLSKDKLMSTGGLIENISQNPLLSQGNTFYQSKTNAIDQISRDNVLKHLQDLLSHKKQDTRQMKQRLQRQLQQLQRRDKADVKQLSELDRRCNELIAQNRNLKFEYERSVEEHQQIERDQGQNVRTQEERLRQAHKQLVELESKFEQIEDKMSKQHEMKMKSISRDWQARVRAMDDKIRQSQNQNNSLDNQLKKHQQKQQRVRLQYLQQEAILKTRIQDEQNQRYGFKLSALESKLKQLQQSRQRYLRRNQMLLYELEKTQTTNNQDIVNLEDQLQTLKFKEQQLVQRNKNFLSKNQKLKSQLKLKQIQIEKLQQQANQLNEQIDSKKIYNRDQINKIITDNAYNRGQKQQDKRKQIQKLNEYQATLRNTQLENAKFKQQYAILAQRLQIGLGQSVQQVFTENNFY